MSRKQYSLGKQLIVATALALGACGVAIADDSSMRRFGGDSYAYFNNQPGAGSTTASSDWRQSHPNGLVERDLQAASSSSLAAVASQLDNPSSVVASAPADPTWRQNHPNGLTERDLQALSSSSLAMWQSPNEAEVVTAQSNIAQSPSKEMSLARK